MEFAPPGMGKGDFAAKKQVDLTVEWAFRTLCTFGHGLDQAVIFGEPVDDQAGLRETGDADHYGFRGLHAGKLMNQSAENDTDLDRLSGDL